jgi:phosphoglycolate phosphatase
VGEDVEIVGADRVHDAGGDLSRIDAGFNLPLDFGNESSGGAVWIKRPRLTVALGAIAPTLADPGAHEVRTEHADADAERGELHSQPFRDCDDCELGRGIGAEPHVADHAGHRCGIDDMSAFVLRAHMRQERANTVDHAHQVDVDHPAPIVDRDMVDAAACGDTGIIAEDVDFAEGGKGRVGGAFDLIGIGDITGNAANTIAVPGEAFQCLVQRPLLDIGQYHLHALIRKGLRHREANTGRPSGDEGCFSLEFLHRHPPDFCRISNTSALHDATETDSALAMPPLAMPQTPTIVFDLDGTLVDTAPDLIGALNFVLAREGLPPLPLAKARNMIGAGARKLIERGMEAEGRNADVAEMTRLTADFIAYYADHIADTSRPFEGLEGALDDLSARGYRLAVCTNKLEWLSRRLLDRLGLSARFAAICGADTFGVAKPDPAILRQTVARANGDLATTIMVGDAGPDIGVARRTGVPVIGVGFGYTEVPIADLKPDLLISHMRDLPAAVHDLISLQDTSATN